MSFVKAQRKQAKLRLALSGPSGSGKTYSALLIAKGLGCKKIAVIDTERGSASLYEDLVDFDTTELNPPYAPERFIEKLREAETLGYEACIIDSITHEWNGSGGCLQINETLAKAKYKGNTWSAWNETTPRHQAFMDSILQSPIHVIATMRSKTETVQEDRKVLKLGMKSEQREGTEYEFTVQFDIQHDTNFASAVKDRSRLFKGKPPFVITPETGRQLLGWLNSGVQVYATDEQVAELEKLVKDAGVTQETVNRWLETAQVGRLSYMPVEYVVKCIEFCRKKLPAEPAAQS